MVDFSNAFPDGPLMEILGDDVSYIAKGGTAAAIKAIVDFNVERIGDESYTPELQTEIEALKTVVTNPRKGDQFVYNGKTYIVDGIVTDDGTYVRMAVRDK